MRSQNKTVQNEHVILQRVSRIQGESNVVSIYVRSLSLRGRGKIFIKSGVICVLRFNLIEWWK